MRQKGRQGVGEMRVSSPSKDVRLQCVVGRDRMSSSVDRQSTVLRDKEGKGRKEIADTETESLMTMRGWVRSLIYKFQQRN